MDQDKINDAYRAARNLAGLLADLIDAAGSEAPASLRRAEAHARDTAVNLAVLAR